MGRPRKYNPVAAVGSTSRKISALPGNFDVNTAIDIHWESLLKRFSKTARVYGFSRVEVPFMEDSRLYEAFFAGHNTDFLVKQETLGHIGTAMRPLQLPGILRNFNQQKLYETPGLHKWHYSGFNLKKDLDGNLVSDFEYGCEILGVFNHLTEAQGIAAAWEFVSSLGFEELMLEVNNLGGIESQEIYTRALVDMLMPKKYELCDDCNDHLVRRPLYVFRCEKLDCQTVLSEAPQILDFLDQDSRKDFTAVLEALDEMNIPYQLNSFYVGKHGQEKTNFSIKCKAKGQMVILCEGAHHTSLANAISGKAAPAFGFSGSMLLLRNIMEQSNIEAVKQFQSEVCLVPLGELAAKRSLRLFRDLTAHKILVYDHFGLSGVKNQLKVALEHKVPIALIMGQKEAMDEMVILRDVKSGMQEIISYDKIVEEVKKRLGK
jgi:histidyl-tRNA synthetase